MTMTEERTALEDLEQHLVPIFVYGTLRVNEGNYMWARPCVVYVVEGAITRGQLFYVGSHMSYPVARFERDGTIVGDVLWCDPTIKEFDEMVGMEIGAGYSMRYIDVQLPATEDSEPKLMGAFGFQYDSEPRGDRITNGDWKNRH